MIFLQILKSFFVWIFIISPISIFYTFPFYCLKLFHKVLAKVLRSDLTPLTKWQDVMYSNVGDNENIGGFVFVLNGSVCVSKVRKHFYETFLSPSVKDNWRYENFSAIFVKWGCYLFKKKMKEIDLKEHILEYDGPVLTDLSEVKSFVSAWIKKGKQKGVPCWEILVVNNVAEKNYFLFKCHHGLMDGYSIALFMEKLTGIKFPYQHKENPEPLRRKAWLLFQSPAIILDRFLNRSTAPSFTKDNNGFGMDWTNLDVSKVRGIRKKLGVRFTSVIAGLQVGAWRKFVEAKTKFNLGDELSFPFPTGTKISHPAMSGKGFTNNFSIDCIEIPTNYDSLSAAVLTAEKNYFKEADEGKMELISLILIPLLLYPIPYQLLEFLSANFGSKLVPSMFIGFSAHMFTEEKMVLLGRDVEELIMIVHAFAASPTIQMCNVTATYNGKLSFSTYTKTSIMNAEELKFFMQLLKNELDEWYSSFESCKKLNNETVISIERPQVLNRG